MIRVVIDTNVLVSGLLKAHGKEAAVLFAVAEKKALWCVSSAILAEYEEVLRRPKFSRIPQPYINALLTLAGRTERVTPAFTVTVSPHEPDNRFLECAEAARADYLITGNQRHFPQRYKTTKIVTPTQFLEVMRVMRVEPDERKD
jgi:uncharacterized protein